PWMPGLDLRAAVACLETRGPASNFRWRLAYRTASWADSPPGPGAPRDRGAPTTDVD
ncbi:MAG: hypothetical protein FJ102_18785, partial [Deltaproteobacteria bacterium]|nr:hypothetical protein [Deltaproteobacteria bacterium]